jgi:predicted P-loop ATPase/GTPase
MSVIALTPNIEVQGILSKDNTNTTFSLNLIRQT